MCVCAMANTRRIRNVAGYITHALHFHAASAKHTNRGRREGEGDSERETASNTNTKAAKGIQIAIIYHVEIAASHTPPKTRRDSTRLICLVWSGLGPRLGRLFGFRHRVRVGIIWRVEPKGLGQAVGLVEGRQAKIGREREGARRN